MIRGASGVGRAPFVSLVSGSFVLAIIYSVAELRLRNASSIAASKFAIDTWGIGTSLFVTIVFAVILVVTLPALEDTTAIVAPELIRRARVERTVFGILVGVIAAIIIAVARPHSGNALAILAVKLCRITCVVLGHAHLAFVDQL